MTSATIPRLTAIPDTLDDLDQQLAIEAYQQLGYRALSTHTTTLSIQKQLYASLLAAGIQPLDPEAVRRYKNHVVAGRWLKAIGLQLATVGAVPAIWLACFKLQHVLGMLGQIMSLGSIVLAMAASVTIWVMIAPMDWEWRRLTLSGYEHPVPAHILSLALQAKKVVPYGTFRVDEFAYHRREVLDPFLLVEQGNAIAYLGVWDEPSFK